jgi:hypothetical protein
MKKYLFLILLATGTSSGFQLPSADSLQSNQPSLSGKVRVGSGLFGLVYDCGVFYNAGKNLVAVRYLASRQLEFPLIGAAEAGPPTPRPLESIWEIAALVGRSISDKGVVLSAFAGISITGGVRRGNLISHDNTNNHDVYESLNTTAIGVPILGELAIYPTRYVGLSASYIANINEKREFGGFVFGLVVTIP